MLLSFIGCIFHLFLLIVILHYFILSFNLFFDNYVSCILYCNITKINLNKQNQISIKLAVSNP